VCKVAGIGKKIAQSFIFIYASNFQIICLLEIWMSEGIMKHEILPQA